MSHVSADFVPVFGDCIRMLRWALFYYNVFYTSDILTRPRTVLYTKDAQPILVAGSGTLGWDMVRPPNNISPVENPPVYFGR